MKEKRHFIRQVTGYGVFAAFAVIVTLVCHIIPQVAGFLTLDLKDAVISIAAFIYGAWAGPVISLIVALIEMPISTTGLYGFLMNFASSATFSLVAALIYKYRRSISGAIIGLGIATVCTTAVMLVLNIFVTPLYFGIPQSSVIDMLATLLMPFNFAKALLNSAVAILLYKPIALALVKSHLLPPTKSHASARNTLIMAIVGSVALSVAVAIIVILMLS